MKIVQLKQLDWYTQFYTLIYIFLQWLAVMFYTPIISSSGTVININFLPSVIVFVAFYFAMLLSSKVLFFRENTLSGSFNSNNNKTLAPSESGMKSFAFGR